MFLKSADYWHRAPVPQRIYESLGPKMKFLVMLRDPVDRLHSDYSFNVSLSKNSRKSCFDSNGPTSLSEFSHKYRQLAMLSFLYFFVVKGKFISAKSLPPVGIEPATQRPQYLQSYAYPIV